ncbi:MAG: aldolase [Nanoarchaeota archaeon]|nr:aldolase [Nanoarchaeota archaeon]
MITEKDVMVPATVPHNMHKEYIKNYLEITRKSGRLMLFAGDQKIEHLNDDFYGPDIAKDDAEPEHLFRIASKANIGVFAVQMGLLSRYGPDYKDVPYLVKMNSKTHLIKKDQSDPFSGALIDVQQVVDLKKSSGLNILAVGYTVYIGSEFEDKMLRQAQQMIIEAHKHGLLTVLWLYPRGKAVKGEKDPHLIAGATGVAAILGSDFVKVNYPTAEGKESKEVFKEAILSAGRTKVVCAGGSSTDATKFLQRLHDQIHVSGAMGNATGRNIHQKPLDEAVRMTDAIYAITVEEKSVKEALKVYNG